MLRKIHNKLIIIPKIGKKEKFRTKKEWQSSNSEIALKLIGKLRCVLDNMVITDYDEECKEKFGNDWWQNIYYGDAGKEQIGKELLKEENGEQKNGSS